MEDVILSELKNIMKGQIDILIDLNLKNTKDKLSNLKDTIGNSTNIDLLIENINNLVDYYKNDVEYDIFIKRLNIMLKICNSLDIIKNCYIDEDYLQNYINKIKSEYGGGSKCKLNKTNDKIKIIYNKKQYERTIYINKNNKKFVKINNKQLELSKLKKV